MFKESTDNLIQFSDFGGFLLHTHINLSVLPTHYFFSDPYKKTTATFTSIVWFDRNSTLWMKPRRHFTPHWRNTSLPITLLFPEILSKKKFVVESLFGQFREVGYHGNEGPSLNSSGNKSPKRGLAIAAIDCKCRQFDLASIYGTLWNGREAPWKWVGILFLCVICFVCLVRTIFTLLVLVLCG